MLEVNSKRKEKDLASAIDIAPTILRRAGIQSNNGVQGRELLNIDAAHQRVY